MVARGADNLRLPAESFYWAVLDGSVLGSTTASRRRRQFGYLFEQFLPVPIEQVHAVYRRLNSTDDDARWEQYLACGMEAEQLRRTIEDADDALVTLAPRELPQAMREDAATETINPIDINLLTGAFEPHPVRALRKRHVLVMLLLIFVCGGLLLVGLERRAAELHRRAQELTEARLAICEEVLPPMATTAGSGQRAELRLIAELRRLRQTHRDLPPEVVPSDTCDDLKRLLRLWPSDVHVQAESLSLGPRNITITVTVPESEDAQTLASAIAPLEGWHLQPPQMNTVRDAVRATLRLAPAEIEETGS